MLHSTLQDFLNSILFKLQTVEVVNYYIKQVAANKTMNLIRLRMYFNLTSSGEITFESMQPIQVTSPTDL